MDGQGTDEPGTGEPGTDEPGTPGGGGEREEKQASVVPAGMSRGKFIMEIVLVRVRFLMLFVVIGVVAGQWDRIMAYWEKWTRPEGEHAAAASETEYYCPMHPQIVRDEPGSCPICGMPLSRRKKGETENLPAGVLARVQLSPYRIAQGGIRTAVVEPRLLVREVSTVGFVEVDERNRARIAARMPGRVERVHVDFTGIEVAAGAPLVEIYSPELVAAEEALLSSSRALAEMEKSGAGAEEVARARRVLEASRDRLLLWGMAPDQVEGVLAGGEALTNLQVRSPLSGTVLEKMVVEGQYVAEGEDLYRIADLRRVWVRSRFFAGDIGLARIGAAVECEVEGFPGEVFRGTVAFVDPVVDPATRTVGVRMDVENPGGRLRPGLYVTARLRMPVADLEPFASMPREAGPAPTEDGAAPGDRAGTYYTCTMHPEVVETSPGKCPICSMELVEKDLAPGESLQWWCPLHPEVVADHDGEECAQCGGMKLIPRILGAPTAAGSVLAVPELSVIDTGERTVVYRVSSPGVFDAVEVVLGARAGAWYPVVSGLSPGDRVASAGAFLIDAETRLNPAAAAAYFGASGSPSTGAPAGGHDHGGK